jgi:hypothetical protein
VADGDHTVRGDAKFDVQLGSDQYPPTFTLIQFAPPGFLVGEDRGSELTNFRFMVFNLGPYQGRATNVTTREPKVNGPFAKMLAKIGYCYAAAECGLDAFDGAAIRDLLASRRDDVYNFVGCALVPEHLTNRHLHGLYLRRRGDFLTVLVHLFASCNADQCKPATPYEVVVGKAL